MSKELIFDYKVTHLDSKNLILTYVWGVLVGHFCRQDGRTSISYVNGRFLRDQKGHLVRMSTRRGDDGGAALSCQLKRTV